ncbi:ribonuclease H-like domain-containing protein [Lentinula raphanica]|uniref:RNA exonuclease 4 n=1 Tax=Lentinula raphanica TaxID=153919 RepID=A0AA38P616_9AGAR|nr:ribonuclease H-like domain-containing protein [Lentinula raphanica]
MSKTVEMSTSASASSNWLALQKTFNKKHERNHDSNRKRRKISYPTQESVSVASSSSIKAQSPEVNVADNTKNGESLSSLKRMVSGKMEYSSEQKQPGKYIAIDCEMVGVGIDGSESSLARVTLVNYYGAVQMDVFVKQRERVVDYRTQYSGIRESDMKKAKAFEEVQKQVADLLQDRILVGHAIHNDLKALLLSHPWNLTRDTQYLAGKTKVVRSKYIALRKLVEQELGVVIQAGEHSSLVDARATMAVYRLHRKEWEKVSPNPVKAAAFDTTSKHPNRHAKIDIEEKEGGVEPKGKRKRKRDAVEDEDEDEDSSNPPSTSRSQPKSNLSKSRKKENRKQETLNSPGGRKGVSSGLSTIVRRGRGNNVSDKRSQWWKDLGNIGSSGSKGSLRI